MIPPKRKRICPKEGHLVEFPNDAGRYPVQQEGGVGLVVDTVGIHLHILASDGTIIKGVRRDTVRIVG